MLIIMGKSASGKNMVRDILVEKYGFHPIVTYTSRPMREGEVSDVTYHYISENDFLQKIESGFFAEWKKYDVNGEVWYYGTSKKDLENADENTVIILTPDGIRNISNAGITTTVIYLYSNLSTIKKRLQVRKDKNDKAEERIKRDLKDFKNAEVLADRIIYNNFDNNINDVVDNVLFHYGKVNK